MPIPANEELFSLSQSRRFMPTIAGRRPSIPTLWRWCRKGIQGVRLEYVRVGRSIVTSKEAVNRFFNALAEADCQALESQRAKEHPEMPPSASSRSASLAIADRVLEEAGITRPGEHRARSKSR